MPQFDSEPRPTSLTKGHITLHQLLVEVMGMDVEDEYRAGRYSIDCYVEDAHAGFEYDGRDFHDTPKSRKRDAERDAWILDNLGIPILRFNNADLKVGPESFFTLVSAWLEVQWPTLDERRRRAREYEEENGG